MPVTSTKVANKALTFSKGTRTSPWSILVYGPEGVGKSSLTLGIEDHLCLDVEQSQNQLATNKNNEAITKLDDVTDWVAYLYSQDHHFKTLVIDGLGRLEALIHQEVVRKAQAGTGGASIKSIEDFGYGKGYQIALDEWRRLVARLDELRTVRKMNVLLLGHAFVKNFKNPDGPDYDRYTLQLHEKSGSFVKEWCDAVLFCRFDESTQKVGDRGRERTKGVMSGDRSLWTVRTAAYDAKNRFGLPECMPLVTDRLEQNWALVEQAMREGLQQKGARP